MLILADKINIQGRVMTVSASRLPNSAQIGSPKVKLSLRGKSQTGSGAHPKMTQTTMPRSQWTMTMKMKAVSLRMHMSLTSLMMARTRR
jgi:cellulase/cellobiase CelA1